MTLHRAIVSLGSNLPCSADIIRDAARRLRTVGRQIRWSGVYFGPDDTGRGPQYANAVMELELPVDRQALHEFTRGLEAAAGRTPESKSIGIMPLDIDLVVWDGQIVDAYDFSRDYFKQGYSLISDDILS